MLLKTDLSPTGISWPINLLQPPKNHQGPNIKLSPSQSQSPSQHVSNYRCRTGWLPDAFFARAVPQAALPSPPRTFHYCTSSLVGGCRRSRHGTEVKSSSIRSRRWTFLDHQPYHSQPLGPHIIKAALAVASFKGKYLNKFEKDKCRHVSAEHLADPCSTKLTVVGYSICPAICF